MDIKNKVEEIAGKIAKDPSLLKEFNTKPAAVIKKVAGIELPEEQVSKAVELVKAKINIDKAGDALGAIGSLLGKK